MHRTVCSHRMLARVGFPYSAFAARFRRLVSTGVGALLRPGGTPLGAIHALRSPPPLPISQSSRVVLKEFESRWVGISSRAGTRTAFEQWEIELVGLGSVPRYGQTSVFAYGVPCRVTAEAGSRNANGMGRPGRRFVAARCVGGGTGPRESVGFPILEETHDVSLPRYFFKAGRALPVPPSGCVPCGCCVLCVLIFFVLSVPFLRSRAAAAAAASAAPATACAFTGLRSRTANSEGPRRTLCAVRAPGRPTIYGLYRVVLGSVFGTAV